MDEPAAAPGRPDRAGGTGTGAAATDRALSVVSQAEELAKSIRLEAEERSEATLREAEAEAWQILRAARREADSFLLERRRQLTDLAENLSRRAETALSGLSDVEDAQHRLGQLVAELHDTSERLLEDGRREATAAARGPAASFPGGRRPGPATAAAAAPPEGARADARNGEAAATPSAEPAASPTPAAEAGMGGAPVASQPDQGFDAALQVAAQMAIAGGTRREIADHLKRAFGLQDPHWILNDVFGEGGGPR